MKKTLLILKFITLGYFFSFFCQSCKDDTDSTNDNDLQTKYESTQIEGVVTGFDSYGMLEPSFTPQEMKIAGFDYGDLLSVTIGDSITLSKVPFITGFNEVGIFETCLCDYNAQGITFGFGMLHGNFERKIGGKIGDKITVKLYEKAGYMETYNVMHSVYDSNRDKYNSDEIFANFREINTTGIAPKVLYRSSNPFNLVSNPVRYAYADRLAEEAGIATEIDLSDTESYIRNYMTTEGFSSTYCPTLLDQGKVIALGLNSDTYSETFMKKLGDGLRFMIKNNPPYLIHCNEGKDRCGFVSFLLEALTGATYEEITRDYMQTLSNFYFVETDSYSYNVRKRLSIDRLIWLLENESAVEDFTQINWSDIEPEQVNLQKAAHDYIIGCGLNETECNQLIEKLTNR